MWEKWYEMANGHQTGRWQWSLKDNSGHRIYPDFWLWADQMCVPPDMGHCILESKKVPVAKSL